jgi:hypothetical protein
LYVSIFGKVHQQFYRYQYENWKFGVGDPTCWPG